MVRFLRRTTGFIIRQLFEAVAFAHEKGILHRDIKPENILFTKSRILRLADFGLAKSFRGDPAIISRLECTMSQRVEHQN
jgi:serine/threonine protein kinase